MYAEDDAMKPDHKKALDAAADKVLAFRPKPKSGPAKARKLRKAKLIREKKKDARE